jgi:dynamin 1/3
MKDEWMKSVNNFKFF